MAGVRGARPDSARPGSAGSHVRPALTRARAGKQYGHARVRACALAFVRLGGPALTRPLASRGGSGGGAELREWVQSAESRKSAWAGF